MALQQLHLISLTSQMVQIALKFYFVLRAGVTPGVFQNILLNWAAHQDNLEEPILCRSFALMHYEPLLRGGPNGPGVEGVFVLNDVVLPNHSVLQLLRMHQCAVIVPFVANSPPFPEHVLAARLRPDRFFDCYIDGSRYRRA